MAGSVIDSCSEGDLKRFAACWLASSKDNVDWDKALKYHGSEATSASFKTVSMKATNKVVKAIDGTEGEGGDVSTPAPKKKAAPRKRKAAHEGGSESPKKKAKGAAAKSKKAKSEEKVVDDDEAAVKTEEPIAAEEGDGELA